MDISSILGSLSRDEIDGLRKTAEAIFAPGAGEGVNVPGIPGLDEHTLGQITQLSRAFSKNDHRTDLINALKPFLKEPRRKRADEAISFIRMMNALSLLQEGGLTRE